MRNKQPFSGTYFGMHAGATRPADKALNNLPAGRGFYVETPNRDTSLTITLMIFGGLAGCIGVTLYFIVQMAIQIAGWAV